MTHEDFKNILSSYTVFPKETVEKFLDGMIEDETLQTLFDQWKTGDNRPIWEMLDFLQQQIYISREKLRVDKTSTLGIIRPKDHNLPRKGDNKNWISKN